MFLIIVLLIILGAIYCLANDPSTLKKLRELSAQPAGNDTKVNTSNRLPVRSIRKETSTRTALLEETQKSKRTDAPEAAPSASTEALKKEVENIDATTPNTAIHVSDTKEHVSKEQTSGRINLKDHHKRHSTNHPSTN
uniref:Secreted protein n=1 Tax=Strongyloides papillosus TaxID=174720 RepID=A0A0N5BRC5_STREA